MSHKTHWPPHRWKEPVPDRWRQRLFGHPEIGVGHKATGGLNPGPYNFDVVLLVEEGIQHPNGTVTGVPDHIGDFFLHHVLCDDVRTFHF